MTITATTNEVNASNQRQVINEMRKDGTLFSCIVESITGHGGVVSRETIIAHVVAVSGLTNDEATATHLAESGTTRNTLQDIVGFVSTDMKHGVYGDEAAQLHTDGSGIWMLDGVINITKAQRIYTKNSAKTKTAKAELDAQYKQELVEAYKELSDADKAAFKKSGGDMKTAIAEMFATAATAEEALFKS